jgi:ribosomal protein S18 acetylase RimI-like enzyme
MDTLNITLLELSDIPEAAQALSIAMLDNPIHMAVFKGNGERQRLEIERIFLELFHDHPGITFLAKESGKIVGVMRMKSCMSKKTEDKLKEQQDENDINYRKAIWLREWSSKDPAEQHWHLGPIGVLPSHRKLGIGSRLMELFCREVDKCSAKAFLETDLDINVIFYRKFGFEVVSKSKIFEVESRYMLRGIQA